MKCCSEFVCSCEKDLSIADYCDGGSRLRVFSYPPSPLNIANKIYLGSWGKLGPSVAIKFPVLFNIKVDGGYI